MAESSSALPLVLPLDSEQATLELTGGKGASLARLVRAELPVPDGFTVTTAAYRRFVDANELQAGILAAASEASAEDIGSLARASAAIEALFDAAPIDDELAAAIGAAYAGLCGAEPGCPVAVRSSATAEDLPELSFAGQQESFLNIRGTPAVLDAVKRCWASLWTDRAIGYRARQGIAPGEVSLAVVVQALVPAQAAGIMFTADPVSGNRERLMINAAWGLGEAIVGGLVTPDTIVVDKQSGATVRQEVAAKDVMTLPAAGGTAEAPVPAEQRDAAVLDARDIDALRELGTRVEQLYGVPMDIEWAKAPERIWLVQARPITALPEPAGEQAAAWALPDPALKYMRASVIELLPDPISPLFETLALPRWNNAMLELFQEVGMAGEQLPQVLTTVNGYAYYGLDSKLMGRLLLHAGSGILKALTDWFPHAERRWREQGRAPYEQVTRQWQAVDLHATSATTLLDGVEQITAAAAQHYLMIQSGVLPAAYISELLFTEVYDALIRRKGDPPALAFMLGLPSTPLRAEQALFELGQAARETPALAEYLERTPAAQLAAQLGAGQAPDGVPAEAWDEFGRSFGEYLEHYGHTVYDLDFAKPVPADDPAPLLDALRYFVASEASDPGARRRAAAAERDHATAAVLRRRGLRVPLFWKLLRIAQSYAPLREDALADVGLGWPVLRRMLAEIGARLVAAGALDSAGDSYWLKADELRSLAQALDDGALIADQRAVVAERRAAWSAERKQTPPVALPIVGGTKMWGIEWGSLMPARSSQSEGDVIRGIGTSPGRVTATARVINGPEEFGTLGPGEVLVARITTPAWTPLFGRAAGVVTDIGGPLSHGSIVAREYRIPAVLGTGTATERIPGGRRVTVDGDAGSVTIHDPRIIANTNE